MFQFVAATYSRTVRAAGLRGARGDGLATGEKNSPPGSLGRGERVSQGYFHVVRSVHVICAVCIASQLICLTNFAGFAPRWAVPVCVELGWRFACARRESRLVQRRQSHFGEILLHWALLSLLSLCGDG